MDRPTKCKICSTTPQTRAASAIDAGACPECGKTAGSRSDHAESSAKDATQAAPQDAGAMSAALASELEEDQPQAAANATTLDSRHKKWLLQLTRSFAQSTGYSQALDAMSRETLADVLRRTKARTRKGERPLALFAGAAAQMLVTDRAVYSTMLNNPLPLSDLHFVEYRPAAGSTPPTVLINGRAALADASATYAMTLLQEARKALADVPAATPLPEPQWLNLAAACRVDGDDADLIAARLRRAGAAPKQADSLAASMAAVAVGRPASAWAETLGGTLAALGVGLLAALGLGDTGLLPLLMGGVVLAASVVGHGIWRLLRSRRPDRQAYLAVWRRRKA